MRKYFILCVLLILTACHHQTQLTSGESYLAKYQQNSEHISEDSNRLSFEDQLRKVASVEPTLTFPARIGLARIDNGRLSTLSGEEIAAWEKAKANLGKGYGEFIPINPLVAKMAAQSVISYNNDKGYDAISLIRLGAARQHLDAVLIYESYSKTGKESNILSIADLTIIGGYLLPSEQTHTQAYANAMLIDVIQGYPYGTADAIIDKETAYGSSWGWGSSRDTQYNLEKSTKTKAVIKLTGEVEKMLKQLRLEVAEKQLNKK